MQLSRLAHQAPDTLYVNGSVWSGHGECHGPGGHQALAVSRGRVAALGTDHDVLALAGPGTEVIDLRRHRVVPGLIDGHAHAVRAGATWADELHWSGVKTLDEALSAIRDATRASAPGTWIRVIGGWHPTQFAERRSPSRAELDAVAPDRPVYVQALYDLAVLNSTAADAVGLDDWAENLPGGAVERDPATGRATGVIRGMGAFNRVLAAMPDPSPEARRASTRAMLADLNALGLTGVLDPGGFGMAPERYDTLFDLWRAEELTARFRLFASAVDAGQEIAQLEGWLRHTQAGFGDAMVRMTGIGEVVHYGCHDFEGLEPFELDRTAHAELSAITRRVAERGWPMHIHAVLDTTIGRILDVWEEVDRDIPIRDMRFSLAHADTISSRNLHRLATLGAGVIADDHQVFKAAASAERWGSDAMANVPPLGDLLAAGIPLGAGTDASRASSHNPWLALWWLHEGRSLDGSTRRAPHHRLTRAKALELYTRGNAWFSFEEADRGHLAPGARADLAVLSDDYFSVPAGEIAGITSLLTLVGGKPVHATGPFDA
ncbi:amidohydrolase [Streptomyces sp. TS71-3]|uniref:amidohydrolase n=1 Tax=Streptomyces sp. TS71-3 TaxID=2733862 RepID=UPI001B132412|nr:amidohydrolase [Streptomyces sp. TS71-3]GHJ38483.1 amidohydrolase [Streptomyces sp. TS71-3]